MNTVICPHCNTKVTPSKPSKLYKCGNCQGIFRVLDLVDPYIIQQTLFTRAKELVDELNYWLENELNIPEEFLKEAKDRLEKEGM